MTSSEAGALTDSPDAADNKETTLAGIIPPGGERQGSDAILKQELYRH
jgi:hypothetical protein